MEPDLELRTDILAQPEALRRLATFYQSQDGLARLSTLSAGTHPVFTGMGASYYAALVASYHLQSLKIACSAIESADLLHYSQLPGSQSFVISQSGASGEIVPLVERFQNTSDLIAVTNHPESILVQAAKTVLPMLAGEEKWVATKTYVNTLALLWLAVRHMTKRQDGTEFDNLMRLADRCDQILSEDITPWLQMLASQKTLVFLGHGPHYATARQAAMMLVEWAKVPALSATIGAFHHGLIELASPTMGTVIFASGALRESAYRLAEQLQGYGVKVLLVENGQPHTPNETIASSDPNEFLAPILDILPVQLCIVEFARRLGITPGFRHLSKVVTKL